MKSVTKTQLAAVVVIAVYCLWEWVLLANWKANTPGPHIRVDLLAFYPAIAILLACSVWQIFR